MGALRWLSEGWGHEVTSADVVEADDRAQVDTQGRQRPSHKNRDESMIPVPSNIARVSKLTKIRRQDIDLKVSQIAIERMKNGIDTVRTRLRCPGADAAQAAAPGPGQAEGRLCVPE